MTNVKLYKRNVNAKIAFKPLCLFYRMFGIKRKITQDDLYKGYWFSKYGNEYVIPVKTIDVTIVAEETNYIIFIHKGLLFRINKKEIEFTSVPCDSTIDYVNYANHHKLISDYFILNKIQIKMPNWLNYNMFDCNGDMIGYKFKPDQLYYRTYLKDYFQRDGYDYIRAEAINCAGDNINFILSAITLYELNYNKVI